jgi:hypothetical protein
MTAAPLGIVELLAANEDELRTFGWLRMSV